MTRAIPGLRGIEHIGLTVPDLTSAVDFFETLLGAEKLYTLGPVQATDNWMAVNLGVDSDALIREICVIRIGQGPMLELFEYADQDTDARQPANDKAGGHHLAFYVADMEAGVQAIRDYGCLVLGEPKVVTEGPSSGLSWVYFLAPWGLQLELVSYPQGVMAFTGREPAVWRPGVELDSSDETADEA